MCINRAVITAARCSRSNLVCSSGDHTGATRLMGAGGGALIEVLGRTMGEGREAVTVVRGSRRKGAHRAMRWKDAKVRRLCASVR